MKAQEPIFPNEWLFEEVEGTRTFYQVATLPDWKEFLQECTTAEKEQWEAEHPIENIEES